MRNIKILHCMGLSHYTNDPFSIKLKTESINSVNVYNKYKCSGSGYEMRLFKIVVTEIVIKYRK